ncbi:hypothetical protein Y1Q_0014467 [Alligator mississippiensis]|nr:hypothetical protein Y1Q_0014467 [Alligator mississippiensis]
MKGCQSILLEKDTERHMQISYTSWKWAPDQTLKRTCISSLSFENGHILRSTHLLDILSQTQNRLSCH